MKNKMPVAESPGRIPKALQKASSLRVFTKVAKQDKERGWALLIAADLCEMLIINGLEDCGLIAVEPDSHRFDVSGNTKSAEVICRLTKAGRLAANALAAKHA